MENEEASQNVLVCGLDNVNETGENSILLTDPDLQNENSNESEEKAKQVLKVLEFRNPGPQLQGFNPDTSRREQRKLRRLVQTTKKKMSVEDKPKRKPKRALHDSVGCRIIDGKDICDCQDVNCPGCHFPCPACGSEKCGVECRIDRRWTYDKHVMFNNPLVPASTINNGNGREKKGNKV